MRDLSERHLSTQQIARYFEYAHLKTPLRQVSQRCHDLAEQMIGDLPDGPELTAGLRKLLEAKDCFVRASLDTAQEGPTS
ncbi:hypothetical protein GCM10023196_035400 [Actinoallomurus vinaceus]|uniref:Uncharacterized protein n=1 Tax=Actinoallomurus vinaceus TaxID=1080074 RepID=A0ABP8UAF9_9ACTN